MADFSAEIVINFPTDKGPAKSGHLLEASSMQELKHKIYLLTFEDIWGENDAALRQWKADNQIRGKK
jgi:hypothetical protein